MTTMREDAEQNAKVLREIRDAYAESSTDRMAAIAMLREMHERGDLDDPEAGGRMAAQNVESALAFKAPRY